MRRTTYKNVLSKLMALSLSLILCLSLPCMGNVSFASGADTIWQDVYDGLENHKRVIKSSTNEILPLEILREKALSDNTNDRIGDFLFYENISEVGGDYTWDYEGDVDYNLEIKYNYSKNTANLFEKELKKTVGSLNLEGLDDFGKVVAIHDYVVNNVHYKDTGKKLCHTAAGALLKKTAVCSGYALLFYRMCKEAGVPVRYITGYGIDFNGIGAHAWNLVKVNGSWYNMDVTWDTVSDNEYFLRSDADFYGHVRDPYYDTADFKNKYPIAGVSIQHP